MRRIAICVAGGWLVLCLACASAWASGLQVTQANSTFPQRAVVVSGRGIGSLSPQSVHIIENGVPVKKVSVDQLSNGRANEFGIVLVIDVSPTVSAIEHAISAARGLATYRPPNGLLGIVEADSLPPTTLGLTRAAPAINNAVATAPVISHHGLHVYDAVLLGVQMLRNAKIAAGSVIVLSDGADRGEPATLTQIGASAGAAHIRIFSVGIASPHFDAGPLSDLARLNGGAFIETGYAHLSQIFTGLESQLSNEYLVRYRSAQRPGQQVAASIHIARTRGTYDISYAAPSTIPTAAPRPSAVSGGSSFWTSTAAAVVVSVLCAILLGVAVLALLSRRKTLTSRLAAFVGSASPGRAEQARTLVERALGERRRRRFAGSGRLADLLLEIELSGIDIAPGRLAWLTAAGTVLVGVVSVLVASSGFAVLIGLIVPIGVWVLIHVLANRQRRQFDEQLPDNLQIIASALRAGHTFGGSLAVVVEDAPEPSRREFQRALADEQLGVPLVDALDRVGSRMRSNDFEHVTLVARLQRETGGNTAEVLDLVTETIRERLDLRRMVRALTAQGRLSGTIVSALPVVLLLGISLIHGQYLRPLFHTTAGIVFLVVGAAMTTAGAFVIRRIVDIEA